MRTTRHLITTIALFLVAPLVACSPQSSTSSALSGHGDNGTHGDCTLTQGYWKNHPKAWAVASLKLGTTTYTKDQLIEILKTPVKGNGLVQLAHQLIAAKLNVAGGVPDTDIKAAIQQADALIGALVCPPVGHGELATSATSALTEKLDAFNSGKTGPGHCGDNEHGDDDGTCDEDSDTDTDGDGQCEGDQDDDTDTDTDEHGDHCDHDDDHDGHCDHGKCGNGKKESGEGCDDGNTANGDGCSSTCQVEVCVCGDGVKSAAEGCDDGNTVSGDGCSSTCEIELPVCGNGKIETGETCDDGNTLNGDGCSSVCICEPCH